MKTNEKLNFGFFVRSKFLSENKKDEKGSVFIAPDKKRMDRLKPYFY
ncbi:hypothetical protein [Apilactobacillus timberlakei]|nr:hypothetical protein [Apilactobacillus timberlakei]